MPDEELMAAAKAGKLSNSEELERQALRMIKSPKIYGFVVTSRMAGYSWMSLELCLQTVNQYGCVNDLENAGRQETVHFVKYLLATNGKLSDFLNSDYTFMNKGLAKFYGYKNLDSFGYDTYTKTKINDPRRGGLLGHMSLLTATANEVDTTPIIRGVWVIENLFGEHLEAPPGIAAVEPDVRGAKTIRDLLEKHRTDKNCYACHKKIDPPGFALENFDHIGRWRNVYNEHLDSRASKKVGIEQKLSVDSKGEMSNGQNSMVLLSLKRFF